MRQYAPVYEAEAAMAGGHTLISPPVRTDGVGTALILLITLLVSIAPAVGGHAQVGIGAATFLTTAVAAWYGSRHAVSLGLFWAVVAASKLSGVYYQQITLGCSIIAYVIIVWVVPPLRFTMAWARVGRVGREVFFPILFAVLTANVGLALWYRLTSPDLNDLVRNFVPDLAPAVLIAGAVAFSMVNALVEEVAFRGVLMHALDAALGAGAASVVLQAIPFGLLHLGAGFPRGWIGVGLAMIYGILRGMIRRRAHGMLAPWLAHVCTDISIGVFVLTLAP